MPRKPSPHGLYCEGTRSSYKAPCNDPALWVVYWGDPKADEVKTNYACAYHLHKLLVELTPKAEFSREMFRVLPLDMIAEWNARQDADRQHADAE
ncbi:hypothetical protein ACH4UM_24045 [Streptomyces sp. NPDC020801]|uniref:hypothetical protein n=1 Tax=Streptomyces sp. NPDC020801 TaxID=3365093 RepID=UPI00379BF5D0